MEKSLTEEQKKANEAIRKCGCMCHNKGVTMLHMMACCSHTYEKIFTELVTDNKKK